MVTGIMTGTLYALVAVAFVLIYKSSGVLNFAQGELVMFGAFICSTALNSWGLSVWLIFVITFLFGGFLGWLMERFSLRPLIGESVLSMIIMTLALSATLWGVVVLVWGAGIHSLRVFPVEPLHLGSVTVTQAYLWGFIAAIFLFLALTFYFQRTKAGLAMRATAEDHQLAQSAGITVKSVFSQAWITSGAISTVIGALLGSIVGVSYLLSPIGLKALPAALLGGLDSIVGAMIAGPIIGILENLAAAYIDPITGGGIANVFPFIIMIIVLVLRPYGFFGLKRIERV